MVRATAREGGNWFYRPSPESGELLSSWLLRLSKGYQKSPILIAQGFSNSNLGVLRNPDLSLKSEILHKLAEALKKPPEIIEGASLARMVTNTGVDLSKKQIKPYWLVAARRSQGHQTASLPIQYCVQCLQEKPFPYFRKEWAFAFVVACRKHNALLSQACPSCKTRDYYSGSWSTSTETHLVNAANHCLECSSDLTKQNVLNLDSSHDTLFEFQSALIKGAEQGVIKFGGFEGPSNKLFRWLGDFARWSVGRKAKSSLAKYLDKNHIEIPSFEGEGGRIEHWEPSQRILLMKYMSELFMNWPHNFLAVTTKAKLRQKLANALELALSDQSKQKLQEHEKIPFRRRKKVWNEGEIELMRELAGQGMAADEIAKRFKSTEYAIRSQCSIHRISLGKRRKLNSK